MNNKNSKQYNLMELNEEDLDPDPFKQFRFWYEEAMRSELKYPDAVTLSTSTPGGRVSSRIVLYKGIDSNGLRFYTNSGSRKGKELDLNPSASLCFWWEPLERQIRICGKVEMMSIEESDEYFQSRPRGSKLSAWASSQSQVIQSRTILENEYSKYEKKFEGMEIPRPVYWRGYRVIPEEFEFWQGRPNRLHDRLRYTQGNEKHPWLIERLQP